MTRKQISYVIILALVFGAVGDVVFDRLIIPQASRVKGLEWLARYASNSPIVITKREEVVLNEGANFIELAKQVANSTASLYQTSNLSFLGNGIILSSDGLILTTKSVVGNLNELLVVLTNGARFTGLVRALDPKSDLAVLTIQAEKLTVLPFSDAAKMEPGQKILSVGQLNKEFSRDFASGFVTRGVGGNKGFFEVFSSEFLHESFFMDLQLNRGFVGSPVINLEGKLIGMVGSENGKVIISENIQTALSSYLASGKVIRPKLGMRYTELSQTGSQLRGLARPGALVVALDSGSPAAAAGIVPNDLIYEVDGQQLAGQSFEQILNHHAVDEMKLKLLRAGQEVELTVNLQATK